MNLFTIPTTYCILRELPTTASSEKPQSMRTKVYEVVDSETQETYFFKHSLATDHTLCIEGKEVKIGLNIAKELLAMAYAKAIDVNVCDFKFAYHPILDKYGILTRKHHSDARPLMDIIDKVSKRTGNINSYEYQVALADELEKVSPKALLDLYKMHVCDILTFDADRHENNILFKDSTYTDIYPYFDCDYAFNNSCNVNLGKITIEMLILYNMKEFRVLNIIYCLSRLLDPNCDVNYSKEDLYIQVPDKDSINSIISTLNLQNLYTDLGNYLHYIVVDMNKFISSIPTDDYDAAMQKLMRFVPQ